MHERWLIWEGYTRNVGGYRDEPSTSSSMYGSEPLKRGHLLEAGV